MHLNAEVPFHATAALIGHEAGGKDLNLGKFRGEGDGRGPKSGDAILPMRRTEGGSNHPELRAIIEGIFVRM